MEQGRAVNFVDLTEHLEDSIPDMFVGKNKNHDEPEFIIGEAEGISSPLSLSKTPTQ